MGFAGRTGRTQIRHRKKFAFRERFRYDKRAEVSICPLRRSDTCVFVPISRIFLFLLLIAENQASVLLGYVMCLWLL